ncbi:RHS repeat-associated core domain-containing protein [Microbulbifer sp.]|uniref:RHS repeat-associated core domain-containing protein n=1 Tax=Microbulbifer sp. TaxID=1908541 RepID=UPI003F2B4EC4
MGVQEMSPWGARRRPDNWQKLSQQEQIDQFSVFGNPATTRGFTGHEHLDESSLIHMNGRMYDPDLARFVQADPIVHNRFNMQHLNRYSYVWNNPLNTTDPSGYDGSNCSGEPEERYCQDDEDEPIEEVEVTADPDDYDDPNDYYDRFVDSMVDNSVLFESIDDNIWSNVDGLSNNSLSNAVNTGGSDAAATATGQVNFNIPGKPFQLLECNKDVCASRSFKYNSREQIARMMSEANMYKSIRGAAIGMLGAGFGGVSGAALSATMGLNAHFVDSQVRYVPQVGDTVIHEIRADLVPVLESDSGIGNVIIIETIIDSDNIIIDRGEYSAGAGL